VLKNQCEEMKGEFERQIHQLSDSYDHVSKECGMLKNDKAELEKFLEELQVSNSELRKEYNNLEREVSYLNDVLTEQNTELKKVNAFKDEKGLSALITSYEDREITFRKDLARQEELIKSLKLSCETLENELADERRQRFKLEDLNGNLKMEISRYRELNANLLQKNESIVASLLSRTNESKEKYREAENVLGELGRQLEMVKAARIDQHSAHRSSVSLESYEAVLQEKSKL
jgi:chromosome segregation ATPase